ncbi:MAG: tyrosine-type recombinase/integrase, partial [Bacteroidota bacterium]|nr:tyrosine-type recombinase/integrase [Bacteroidota bacterium]
SSISHFYKWLRKTGVMSINPVLKVQVPKIPERLPKSIAAGSINKLLITLNESDKSFGALRDQAMIGLLYGAGLRRSELIQLKWNDLDLHRRTLRILGKGKKYRQVPVNEELIRILTELKEVSDIPLNPSEPLEIIRMDNGKPCYPKYVHNKVVNMLGTVTTADKKSPHILRHSMATHLMDEGAELNAVKGILGHASLAATQVYTHASISRIREVYSKAHPKSGHHE